MPPSRLTQTNLLLLAALEIRLFNLCEPPLDFHSVRQLRSADIARGMFFGTLKQEGLAA